MLIYTTEDTLFEDNSGTKTKYSTLSKIHMIENSIDRMRFL